MCTFGSEERGEAPGLPFRLPIRRGAALGASAALMAAGFGVAVACQPAPSARAPTPSAPPTAAPAPHVLEPEPPQPKAPTARPRAGARTFLPLLQSIENEYRSPGADIEAMLLADPPPAPLVHSRSRRLAFVFREGSVPVDRLASPTLGLAGSLIDPANRTLHGRTLVEKVEVESIDEPSERFVLLPPDGALLDYPLFSPGGRYLAAASVWPDATRIVIYDLVERDQHLVSDLVNASFGAPCQWTDGETLICRAIPEGTEELILPRVQGPSVTEHIAGAAPARTYSNLLQDGSDDLLFEHYFTSELVHVRANGDVEETGVTGIVPHVQVSPDGAYLLTTELVRPYSRIVSAERFARRIRVWDQAAGRVAAELELPEEGAWPTRGYPEGPRAPAWDPARPATLTWIDARKTPRQDRLTQWAAPFENAPDVVAESSALEGYGWTSRGTLYLQGKANGASAGTTAYRLRVGDDWADVTPPSPSSVVLRTNGDNGRVVEIEHPREDSALLFVAGPLEAETGRVKIRSTRGNSDFVPGVLPTDQRQRVIAALGKDASELLVSRETLSSPPNYFVLKGGRARKLTAFASPYPQLRGIRRRPIHYRRSDGVTLSAMLYLPPGYKPGERRPTVLWIYPSDHTDPTEVESERRHEFFSISGPSRFSLLLRGYVLVDHPSMPIIGLRSARNDTYLAQLIASAEAAVEHVVKLGIAAPDRLAVAGRSYGAFSAANLLVHTKLFRTAIAVSGAYNRTLTPFGFQTEQRSFWQAADLYARISPFFYAHQFTRPILLVHGQRDENPGTPASQSARFFQALAGNGAPVRHVVMPFEGHQMRGEESNLHVVTEYVEWLGRQLGE